MTPEDAIRILNRTITHLAIRARIQGGQVSPEDCDAIRILGNASRTISATMPAYA